MDGEGGGFDAVAGEGDADAGGAGGGEGVAALPEESAGGLAFAFEVEGAALDRDDESLVGEGAEGVGAEVARGEVFGEIAGGVGLVGFGDGGEVVEDDLGVVAAGAGVVEERDAVRALDAGELGAGGEGGADDVDVSQHGVGEEVGAGAVGDEEFGDFAAAGVGGGAEGGFPVAEAPVNGGAGEGGAGGDEFGHGVEIEVALADDLPDLGGVLAWEVRGGVERVGGGLGGARRAGCAREGGGGEGEERGEVQEVAAVESGLGGAALVGHGSLLLHGREPRHFFVPDRRTRDARAGWDRTSRDREGAGIRGGLAWVRFLMVAAC